MRRFGDPLAATQWALAAKPAGYGAFMPLVFERAAAEISSSFFFKRKGV